MAKEVITALGITEMDMTNKLIVITEDNNTNSTFLLSSIMSHCEANNAAILLIPFNNTYRHFYHIGMKLGYNLDKLSQSKRCVVVEPLKIINENLTNPKKDQINFLDNENIIKKLFKLTKDKLEEIPSNIYSVYLIIEDISNLLELNIPLKDVLVFKQMLMSLLHDTNNQNHFMRLKKSVVISTAITNERDLIVANMFRHVADIVVKLSGLKTGKSNLVNGLMTINRKDDNLSGWSLQKDYHYKLYDRQIRLFAPGTTNYIL